MLARTTKSISYSSIIHVFDEGVNKGKSTRYECLELSAKVTKHKHTQIHIFSSISNFFFPLTPSLRINRSEQRTILPCFEECKYLWQGCWSFLSLIYLSLAWPPSLAHKHTSTHIYTNVPPCKHTSRPEETGTDSQAMNKRMQVFICVLFGPLKLSAHPHEHMNMRAARTRILPHTRLSHPAWVSFLQSSGKSPLTFWAYLWLNLCFSFFPMSCVSTLKL